jgi:hypothetical protein
VCGLGGWSGPAEAEASGGRPRVLLARGCSGDVRSGRRRPRPSKGKFRGPVRVPGSRRKGRPAESRRATSRRLLRSQNQRSRPRGWYRAEAGASRVSLVALGRLRRGGTATGGPELRNQANAEAPPGSRPASTHRLQRVCAPAPSALVAPCGSTGSRSLQHKAAVAIGAAVHRGESASAYPGQPRWWDRSAETSRALRGPCVAWRPLIFLRISSSSRRVNLHGTVLGFTP